MEKAKILVVEDEAIVAMDIRNRLLNLGHTVPAFTVTGSDALDKTAELHPDLVLMDIQLGGGMDGVETAAHIHRRFHVPVVYLTANSDENTLQRAKLTEPFGYILKPFSERELETTIEMALHRHRGEVKLKCSEALKKAVLESALDGIITIDHEGRIVEFNPAAETIFGYSRAEAVGELLGDLIVPPNLRAEHWRGLAQYLLTGEGTMIGRQIELTAMRADGSEFPAELAITQIDFDGPPMFTGFVRDITERKRTEQQMQKLLEKWQEAMAKVKTLAGMIPICSSCKKIRDDKGCWNQLEVYIREHTDALFSHGYCPDCAGKLLKKIRRGKAPRPKY